MATNFLRKKTWQLWHSYILLAAAYLLATSTTFAAPIADIANTKHNLSMNGTGTVKATSESQICAFCHTPHGAKDIPKAPLWNRTLSGATYTEYNSTSIDATDLGQPSGNSKLCLSCHDGSLAIGTVGVLNGQMGVTIDMNGTDADGSMPPGDGSQTGFTRDLGTDLSNDHPISFTYDTTLANTDGELRNPAISSHIANRTPGFKPDTPLEDNQVQCVSCHDPHVRDDGGKDIKFLRLNRFQEAAPAGSSFNPATDIICLSCHNKTGWIDSAHADPTVGDELYDSTAAAQRDFPANLPVWQAGCLNCHDTHTVQGSRRLLREGTDSLVHPKSGGNPAIEETCYQCHAPLGESILTDVTQVPDIKTDFALPRHMPITSSEQPTGTEVHSIGTGSDAIEGPQRGKDFIESQALLGKSSAGGSLTNRHVECTDCHNPHRVMKNQVFNGNGDSTEGTHVHDSSVQHTNIASGVLRGTWGVEPVYGSASFLSQPTDYTVKRGDGGMNASDAVTSSYVTREYQICLKCHSDYGYDDDGIVPSTIRPALGDSGGNTPSGTNGMTRYTNQAMEFQAPPGHEGEGQTLGWEAGACGSNSGLNSNNHRGWHPVMKPTGRTAAIRGNMNPNNFLPPWNTNIGTQTMYCSDCHGSNTAGGTAEPTGGQDGNPWGPHGSTNDFILKGNWTNGTGTGEQATGLCFKCHDYDAYANPSPSGVPNRSGFSGPFGVPCGGVDMDYCNTNMHIAHAMRIGQLKCNWCHTMVPHGYTNKALLHNVNDVGPEAGLTPCTTFVFGPAWGGPPFVRARPPKNFPPYYYNAMLAVTSFATSGTWTPANCRGPLYMTEACASPP